MGKKFISIILEKKKKKRQNTLNLLKNAAFTVNIRNNVFKYQFESQACVSIQLLPRKRHKYLMFAVNY